MNAKIHIAGVVLIAGVLSGCAAGRADNGAIVLGVEAGRLVETPGQALSAAAGLLPGPWGAIATIATTIIGGGGIAAAARISGRRTGERNGWEEAQALFTQPPGSIGARPAGSVAGAVNAGPAVGGIAQPAEGATVGA